MTNSALSHTFYLFDVSPQVDHSSIFQTDLLCICSVVETSSFFWGFDVNADFEYQHMFRIVLHPKPGVPEAALFSRSSSLDAERPLWKDRRGARGRGGSGWVSMVKRCDCPGSLESDVLDTEVKPWFCQLPDALQDALTNHLGKLLAEVCDQWRKCRFG